MSAVIQIAENPHERHVRFALEADMHCIQPQLCPNLIFRQLYSSYQIVTANRVCQPSASSLCSVIAVDVCVTEALEPRLFFAIC